jgi:hypothetical protein
VKSDNEITWEWVAALTVLCITAIAVVYILHS